MKHRLILAMTVLAAALTPACSDDSDADSPRAGAGGSAGAAGGGGSGGATAGNGGGGGSTNNAGAAGAPVPPTPALPADAPTVACPTVISGALEASDGTQRGRHSRIAPISACGATKGFPGNAADPTNPHYFDVYRFSNPGASAACFTFTLTAGNSPNNAPNPGVADAGADGGVDGGLPAPGEDAGSDAGPILSGPVPQKYMTAHGTFYPTDLGRDHLGDVGDALDSPQTMGITVPAGETIDVVVYGVDVAPLGVGAYTLTCTAQ